jgi:8-oxo-dGTP pyrophosphatase MutT (NUDIX family)/phosphohistidine phosphatase SixA
VAKSMEAARSQEAPIVAQGMNQQVIRAAGGVVWRHIESSGHDEALEVAVIHRPRYDDWSIPKGKLASGESEIEAAVREVMEETGFRVRLGRPLGQVRYLKRAVQGQRPKVVRYWAMQAQGGSFSPNREVDELRWLTPAAAQELLTHERDRQLVDKLVRGPVLTSSVLLVRHACAGESGGWHEDDRLRPLDEKGWEQAQELTRLLARHAVEQIVSADNVRCVQTVKPLGESIGLKIVEEPLFSEHGYPGHEEEALSLLRSYAQPADATVVCSQGNVIPDLLGRLSVEDHVDLPYPPPNKKASVWSLTFDGPRVFSTEYFPPPNLV